MKVANFDKLISDSNSFLTSMAPPDRQVEERTSTNEIEKVVVPGKGTVRFKLPTNAFHLPFGGKESTNKKKTQKRRMKEKKQKYAKKIAKSVDPLIAQLEQMNTKIEQEIIEIEQLYSTNEGQLIEHQQ